MALDKRDLIEALTDNYQPTNTISKIVKANWNVVFGMLMLLASEKLVEYVMVDFSGTRKAYLWRKPQNANA